MINYCDKEWCQYLLKKKSVLKEKKQTTELNLKREIMSNIITDKMAVSFYRILIKI